jgi:leader peptidase (prepilin peptidase)/N-methyltransferase
MSLYIVVFTVLLAAAVIDIREHRIPDRLIIAGIAAGVAARLVNPGSRLQDGIIGGVSAFAVLLVIHLATRGGLGLGDVKLMGCIGFCLGFEQAFSILLIGVILIGLYGLVLVFIDRENRKRELPFAPFLLAGTLIAML